MPGVMMPRSPRHPARVSSCSRATSNRRLAACCASVMARTSAAAKVAASGGRRPAAREPSRANSSTRVSVTEIAEVVRDHVLELVRLVDDRQVALRDDFAEAALAHGRVGAQQVMVDDDDVRVGGGFAHARDEARGEHRAVPSEALLARRGHDRTRAAGHPAGRRFLRDRPFRCRRPTRRCVRARRDRPEGDPAAASRSRSSRCRQR